MANLGIVEATFLTEQADFHWNISRPRPYPYDVTATLVVQDGGAPDTFGAYLHCIPIGTYDFGDVENRVDIRQLNIENISANDTYVMEFYRSPNGVDYTPLGAVRFTRAAVFTRSFIIDRPTRPFGNDHMGLYARLKDAGGAASTVTFSLIVARYLPPNPVIPVSAGPGAWPWS